jgi:hypothetical protein
MTSAASERHMHCHSPLQLTLCEATLLTVLPAIDLVAIANDAAILVTEVVD